MFLPFYLIPIQAPATQELIVWVCASSMHILLPMLAWLVCLLALGIASHVWLPSFRVVLGSELCTVLEVPHFCPCLMDPSPTRFPLRDLTAACWACEPQGTFWQYYQCSNVRFLNSEENSFLWTLSTGRCPTSERDCEFRPMSPFSSFHDLSRQFSLSL